LWTELDECTGDPTVEWLPDIADDGMRAWTEDYPNCSGGAEVKLIGIDGGGHTWPGAPFSTSQDISASAEILQFFSQRSMRQ
jgi:polyhydroxybutyrate depolymerase